MMNNDIVIRGFGRYVPENVLSNADLEKMVDTSDDWITTRTGIKERHIVSEGQFTSDLATEAATMALENAGLEADELTHIIVGTFTPDHLVPSCACSIEQKLGIKDKVAFDIAAACSGFLYALEMARALLTLHKDAKILCIGAEVVTHRVDFTDRGTCVLFGDGAGAAVLTNGGEGPKLLDVKLATDGNLGSLLTVSGGGSASTYKPGETIRDDYFVQLQGREVFKHAVRSMSTICESILGANGLEKTDVDVLLPHQANWRIIDAVGRKLEFPAEKVYSNVERFGNTSAASVPLALSEAVDTGFIKDGDTVLLTSFGGGFTWGSALLKF